MSKLWFDDPFKLGKQAIKGFKSYRDYVDDSYNVFLGGAEHPSDADKFFSRIAAETLWPLTVPFSVGTSLLQDSFPSDADQEAAYHANWIATNPNSTEAQTELSMFTDAFDSTLGFPGEGPGDPPQDVGTPAQPFIQKELGLAPDGVVRTVDNVSYEFDGRDNKWHALVPSSQPSNKHPVVPSDPSAITSRDGINYFMSNPNVQGKKKKNKKKKKQNNGPTKKQLAAKEQKLNAMFRQVAASREQKTGKKRGPYAGKGRSAPMSQFAAPVVTAPTAASTLNQGNRVKFSTGTKGGCRIMTRLFIGKLVFTTTGTTVLIPSATLAEDTSGQWYGNVASNVYMGDSAVPKISQYFDNYLVHSAEMVYSSSTLPSANYKITWCACNSSDHWERIGVANGTAQPKKAEILAMPNSWDFNAWLPEKRIRFPPNRRLLYTATPEGAGLPFDYNANSAAERQSYWGTMGVRVDGTSPGANIDVGDLFLEIDFELIGMTGAYAASVGLITIRDLERRREEAMFSRFEEYSKKKDSKSRAECKERKENDVSITVRGHTKSSSRKSHDSDSEDYGSMPLSKQYPSSQVLTVLDRPGSDSGRSVSRS